MSKKRITNALLLVAVLLMVLGVVAGVKYSNFKTPMALVPTLLGAAVAECAKALDG